MGPLLAMLALFGTPEVEIEIERLGTPVRTARQVGDFFVKKPKGGWWYLTSFGSKGKDPNLPIQVAIVDTEKKTARVERFDRSGVLKEGIKAEDGRFYLGHYGRVGLYRFDPRSGELVWLDANLRLPRLVPQSIARAPGGHRIYLGLSSALALLVELDTRRERFRDFGEQGPSHAGPRYVYSLGADKTWVYSAVGKNPWYLVATHRKSETQRILFFHPKELVVACRLGLCFARLVEQKGASEDWYRLERGRAIWDPKLPEKLKKRKKRKRPVPKARRLFVGADGRGEARLSWKVPDKAWDEVEVTGIQTKPWKISRLLSLSGRLLGAAKAYENLFFFDPRAGSFEVLGKSPISIYSMVALQERVYLLGYPRTALFAFPDLREVHRWDALLETHHARSGQVGNDGVLYFCADADRNAVGGGIGWWDPKKEVAGGLREPFLLQRCAGFASARDGRWMVFSGAKVTDPVTGKTPEEAKLFVFDTEEKRVVETLRPIRGAKSLGPIATFKDWVLGVARTRDNHQQLWAYSLKRWGLSWQRDIEGAPGPNIVIGPDQRLYTFISNELSRVDLRTGKVTLLASGKSGHLEFLGPDLYLAGTPELRRLRAIAEEVRP